MAILSFDQLKQIWIEAAAGTKYATAAWATLMAAIAEAESSGNPQAVNATDNGGRQSSYGLWQISTGTHNPPSPNWADPITNAHLAIGKLNGQGLGAWGTYSSGAYRKYLPGGVSAGTLPSSQNAPIPAETASFDWANPLSVAGSLTSAAKTLGDLSSTFSTLVKDVEWLFVPSHWVRIIAFMFGSGAVAAGTFAMMQTGKGGKGDIVLAMGIGLVSFGGVLLFIAFHNLPTDVKDLGGLLKWLAAGVQGGAQDVQNVQAGG